MGVLLSLVIAGAAGSAAIVGRGSRNEQETLTNSPLILPGDYVGLDCAGGKIFLNSTLICNDTSVSVDLCDAPFCQYSMEGVKLSPQTSFTGWQATGDASVANPSVLNTTLNLTVANVNSHYSGVVNLSIVVPGVYVSLGCTGGEILLNGSLFCRNAQVTNLLLCDAPACQYSMVGVNSNPQGTTFTGWETYGDVTLSNPFSINTTLTLTMPSLSSRYTAVVNLSLKTIQQTTPVQVTIHTFVAYAMGSAYASVTICSSSSISPICPFRNLPNGAVASLTSNKTYEIVANTSFSVEQWDSNAGRVSTATGTTTSIYITSAGIISLIVEGDSGWAGYVNSPASSTGSFTVVSTEFTVPSINSVAYDGTGIWVGIGGFGSGTPLWQAGIEWDNGIIRAFREATSASTGAKVVYNAAMSIQSGNIIRVTVSTKNGVSYATVLDETSGVAWSVSYDFAPNTQSAEWIVEPKFNTISSKSNSNFGQTVTFTDLLVNSFSPTLQGCFFATIAPLLGNQRLWTGALSEAPGGTLYFTVY